MWDNDYNTIYETLINKYLSTGKIGNSRPYNLASASQQAHAIARSILAREPRKETVMPATLPVINLPRMNAIQLKLDLKCT